MKPYQQTKKEFYVNLRSTDASRENTVAGNTLKFSWNIRNIANLSRQAKIGIVSFYTLNGGGVFMTVRCPQVKNISYDSAGSLSTLIYINSNTNNVLNPQFHDLQTQNLDRIDLIMSNDIDNVLNGVDPLLDFYIQMKIYDYDNEDVSSDIMPTYTSKSLSYYPSALNY